MTSLPKSLLPTLSLPPTNHLHKRETERAYRETDIIGRTHNRIPPTKASIMQNNPIVIPSDEEEDVEEDVEEEEEVEVVEVVPQVPWYHHPHPLSFRIKKIGDPIPKPSPRFHAVLAKPMKGIKKAVPSIRRWISNPAETTMKQFRELARQQLLLQTTTIPPIPHRYVWIKAWFCKKPPQDFFTGGDRTRPKPFMEQDNPIVRVMKPDTDNCVKFVLDSLSKVAWSDDDQVCSIEAFKFYDTFPPYDGRTVVEFGVLDPNTIPQVPNWGRV